MGELIEAADTRTLDETRRRPPDTPSDPKSFKNFLVARGIKAVCGDGFPLSPSVAAEIPLASAGVRFLWLRALQAMGCESIVARSEFGYAFLCHLGDLAEHPFYHRKAHRRELVVCAEWLDSLERPVVYDVGANTGFFVTQLAQMTAHKTPLFYAFEAVPQTYSKLLASVHSLGLAQTIKPIAAAVLDRAGEVRLTCDRRNSLLARVTADDELFDSATSVTAKAVTLDEFCAETGEAPSFLKIDVEGAEPAVLRGAGDLLRRHRPAILFEHNADRGCTETAALLRSGPLDGYRLFYVDDLRGQLLAFGSPVVDIDRVSWICNLFAVPEEYLDRWLATIDQARRRI